MQTKSQTERGKRHAQLLSECPTIARRDIEAICFYIFEKDVIDGKVRDNRPLPKEPDQKAFAEQLNDSDAEWIGKLKQYRREMELSSNDLIALNDYQSSWVDYILGNINDKPINSNPVSAELKHVSDIPF